VEARARPDRQLIHRAFLLAAESGERCRPVHLLAALAELDGPIADALTTPGGVPLLPPPADPLPVHGGGASYLAMQTQQAACQLASERGEVGGPQHLLLAVIDQAEPEAVALLGRAGLELGALREAALRILGAPSDLPPIAVPPLTPAGTMDRPPLPVDQLDCRAWNVLGWRQEHLPLSRVRRKGDWYALSHLEERAAWRIADRLCVDDDQRYSMLVHHHGEVEKLASAVRPDLVETRQQLMDGHYQRGVELVRSARQRRRWRRVVPNFMVGWPTWFANRRAGLRDKRFRVLTRSAYRGQPLCDQ
jgi:Clp amino terminal domain, pathogenicity island component